MSGNCCQLVEEGEKHTFYGGSVETIAGVGEAPH